MGELRFPSGFLWGAATSAHQVEGGNHNNWTDWEAKNLHHIVDGTQSGEAADHWHRYGSDYEYLTQMHLGAYRFSVEWSRIEPKAGECDAAALHHYATMLRSLASRGITPMVSLHHFTNPVWIEKLGGWSNPEVVEHFVSFALKVVEEIGEDVQFWCTINEPTVEVGLGYAVGTFPPGQQNLLHFWRARRNMVTAHRQLYEAIHSLYRRRGWGKPQVSFAHHLSYVEPYHRLNPLDRLAAWAYNRINNRYFLDRTSRWLDFVGVNYYFYRRLQFTIGGPLIFAREVPLPNARASDLGWQVVPEGLYRLCTQLKRLGKPIYVTENGLADAKDKTRQWSLVQHARAMHRAIADGADVRGYFHWSLTDTFEWENGYSARYGLVAVDFSNQKRTPRPSAKLYGQIASANALSAELQEEHS
jgi:beta-glucosidase